MYDRVGLRQDKSGRPPAQKLRQRLACKAYTSAHLRWHRQADASIHSNFIHCFKQQPDQHLGFGHVCAHNPKGTSWSYRIINKGCYQDEGWEEDRTGSCDRHASSRSNQRNVTVAVAQNLAFPGFIPDSLKIILVLYVSKIIKEVRFIDGALSLRNWCKNYSEAQYEFLDGDAMITSENELRLIIIRRRYKTYNNSLAANTE